MEGIDDSDCLDGFLRVHPPEILTGPLCELISRTHLDNQGIYNYLSPPLPRKILKQRGGITTTFVISPDHFGDF